MYAPASRQDTQLGVAPVIVAAAIPAASKLVSSIGGALKGIFGGTPKQRQKKRVAQYEKLYAASLQGDFSAFDLLYSHSRTSATKESKAAAKALWDKAAGAIVAAGLEVKTAGNHAYVRDPLAVVTDAVTGATIVAGTSSNPTKPLTPAVPAKPSISQAAISPLLLGGAVLAAFLLSRRK